MKRTIDLNCDLGEGAGHDAELMPLISSANIACGAHAGDLATMIETVECAIRHRVAIGAHPGYFDLEHFGRTERDITPNEAGRLVLLQIEQLYEIAGAKLHHVKLHGALYNQVSRDPYLADAVAADLARLWPQLTVYALAGSHLAAAANARGLRVAREVFADRTYRPDGSLTPRTAPNSIIHDAPAAVEQVLRIIRDGKVRAVDGADISLQGDTVCIHGDGPLAVVFAQQLTSALQAAGITVKSIGR